MSFALEQEINKIYGDENILFHESFNWLGKTENINDDQEINTNNSNENYLLSLTKSKHESHISGKYACDYPNCSRSYNQKYRLQIHKRTHTGEKPFTCEYCNKGFTEKGNVKVHMRIHTGEEPFTCIYTGCVQAFKAYGQLKDHLKKHSKVKDFQCDLCLAAFARKSTLKLHQLVHLGIKPHLCPFAGCEKKFTEKSNMRKHEKSHYNKSKKHQRQSNAYSFLMQNETTFLFTQNETFNKDLHEINTPEHAMICDLDEINRANIYS